MLQAGLNNFQLPLLNHYGNPSCIISSGVVLSCANQACCRARPRAYSRQPRLLYKLRYSTTGMVKVDFRWTVALNETCKCCERPLLLISRSVTTQIDKW